MSYDNTPISQNPEQPEENGCAITQEENENIQLGLDSCGD